MVYDALQEKATRLNLFSEIEGSEPLIVAQPLHNYGFDHEGKSPKSVTHIVSQEIGKGRAAYLTVMTKENEASTDHSLQESLSFLHGDRYSNLPLTANPDRLGIFADNLFSEVVAQIFGLPSPCCQQFEDQWIGTDNNEKIVDRYGNAVASARFLPG